MSFAISGTNGATSFTVPSGGGTYTYPLVIYAMIQDSVGTSGTVGGTDPGGMDGFAAAELGIDLTGGLVTSANNAYFLHTGGTAGVAYENINSAKGTATSLWGSGSSGTIGIGCSDTTTTGAGV